MIRVIIERHIKDGSFHDYLDLIRRARKQASSNDGFIAGELLQEKSNQNHAVIISSWENFESWDEWQSSNNSRCIRSIFRGHFILATVRARIFVASLGQRRIDMARPHQQDAHRLLSERRCLAYSTQCEDSDHCQRYRR